MDGLTPTYHPLDAARRTIRLLRIAGPAPDEPDGGPVIISIFTAALDDKPTFHALSYVWGNAADVRPALLDGRPVSITANLDIALRHLRAQRYGPIDLSGAGADGEAGYSGLQQAIWIDALCINQADVDERNAEVRMMADIYSSADKVLVWLGEGDSDSDWFFDRTADEDFVAGLEALSEPAPPSPASGHLRAEAICQHNVGRRPWWSRIWVLQECVLAKDEPVVACGTRTTTWTKLTALLDALNKARLLHRAASDDALYAELMEWSIATAELPIGNGYVDPILCNYQGIQMLRSCFKLTRGMPLCIVALLAGLYQHPQATDPRDLIYGILGMAQKCDQANIPVDYRRDPVDVFRDAAVVMWNQAHSVAADPIFGILYAFDLPVLCSEHWLPSWVPDFGFRDEHTKDVQKSMSFIPGSPAYRNRWRRMPAAKVSRGVLHLQGVLFDRVVAYEEVALHAFYLLFHDVKDEIEILLRLEKLAEQASHRARSGSSRLAAFAALRDQSDFRATVVEMDSAGMHMHRGGRLDELGQLWERYVGEARTCGTAPAPPESKMPPFVLDLVEPLRRGLASRLEGNKVFITESGFLGVGTPYIEKDDEVALVLGMKCPYMLRPIADGEFRLAGFAYVGGLMDFDLLDECFDKSDLELKTLSIR